MKAVSSPDLEAVAKRFIAETKRLKQGVK